MENDCGNQANYTSNRQRQKGLRQARPARAIPGCPELQARSWAGCEAPCQERTRRQV